MINKFIRQHHPSEISKWLNGVFDYTTIRFGKKGQGDIVITNLQPNEFGIDFGEYMRHTHMVDRIEQVGIYTNIYWHRDLFSMTIKHIVS